MTERSVAVTVFTVLVIIVIASTVALHERHYKNRRWVVYGARADALEARVKALEDLLIEAREL